MAAVAAFLAFISVSLIPTSPSAAVVDLGERMNEALARPLSPREATALDRVAETLEAAQRAIKIEAEKSWNLRSYDRARTLLWQAEALFESAAAGLPRGGPSPAEPAG